MTKQEFAETFTLLCATYNREASKALMSAYFMVLEGLTVQEFQMAVKEVLATRKFTNLPMPADILEVIHGNPDDMAMLALKQAEDAVSQHGAYRSVIFQDKALQATIEAFSDKGWIGFCEVCGTDDWKFQKSEFIKLYKAMSKQGRKPKSDYLVGWSEHQNSISAVAKEYDIEIVEGRVKVNGLVDKTNNVYLVGYEQAPYCLPVPVVKAMIKEQTATIENKRDIKALIGNMVKKID